MLLLKEMAKTYIILLILFKKGHSNNFKISFILESVVRLAHKYGLGEKNVRCL